MITLPQILGVCLVGLLLLGWFARGSGPILGRLRALVPAWRFFDRIEPTPQLWVRFAAPGAAYGAWLAVIEPAPRGWVLAPASNLALAYHGIVERLVAQAEDSTANTVTEQLVEHLAHTRVPADLHGVAGARFQWRLVDREPSPTELCISGELTP